jgi:hypothetical protein
MFKVYDGSGIGATAIVQNHGASGSPYSEGRLMRAVFHIDNRQYGPMLDKAVIQPPISKFGSSCPHRSPIDL